MSYRSVTFGVLLCVGVVLLWRGMDVHGAEKESGGGGVVGTACVGGGCGVEGRLGARMSVRKGEAACKYC